VPVPESQDLRTGENPPTTAPHSRAEASVFLQFWDETGQLVAFSDRTILANPNPTTQAIFSEVAGLGGLE
jgi:hypothetical protein